MARSPARAILLIDGYNIVGAWPELQCVRDSSGLEPARSQLIELLTNYSAFKGFDSRLVFDAYAQQTPCVRERITQNLSVYYTEFNQTADTYIEKACAKFRSDIRKFDHRLIVATSDRAQRLTVVGYGAECMSADQLALEVRAAQQRVRQKLRPQKRSSKHFLVSSLNPQAQERLAKLRLGLDQ
ncbi:MAG: NYN domain-containing protein [Leptolyngbyaceae cyanobacterium SL_1_1]|nr:NYN domain-containing protein [Leptolyngbyaceae cyanobacterium RM1_1_2]NJO09028.1 NYN domain-containing protein [Leptolyngbyaceae cyanobacterium SL_1_1]